VAQGESTGGRKVVVQWPSQVLDVVSERNEMNTSACLPTSKMAPTPFTTEPAAATQALMHPSRPPDVPRDIVASK
jgi:hypothetical protein